MSAVLVLDANQRSALSVTRSLGLQGLEVICADSSESALAGASKFCTHYEQYAHPDDSSAFIADVKNIVSKYDVKVLYPVSEIAVYTLLEHRDSFTDIVLPFPDISVVRSVSDKSRLVRLCGELDIAVPSSRLYENAEHFIQSNDSCAFPVFLKPTL